MTTTPTTASRIPFPDLAARIEGALTLPADDEFVHAAQAWNLAVPQHPCAVLHARTAADVVHAVRFAIDHSLPVSAQPGGHGATTATDGSLLIRTAALDDIWIDADARVARVGAGVKWGQLQSALDGTGLTGLVGSSPDVTVVGFCLSGGLSWFGRAHGTGAATIRAVELVDATGAHRWVDDSTDASLMWALRGGGGEFGIVTAMEIALVPAPELTGGRLLFPVEDAPRVWRAFAEVTTVAPRELTLFASVLHFPPIPELPEEIRGRSFCAVDAVLLGGAATLAMLLRPIAGAGTLLRSTIGALQPSAIGDVCEEPVDPTPAVTGSASLVSLDDDALTALLTHASDPACGLVQAQIRHLGGAFRDDPTLPAASGPVAGEYVAMMLAMAPVPEATAPAQAAIDVALDILQPWYAGPTTLSMLGHHDGVDLAFAPDTLRRLRDVKESTDPRCVVRGNFPVHGPRPTR
ncbi:FAD-binding oxidoreductase [Rhodococcus zopfii]|nr:FAD-binding oxidoreductase [Rhodococcus zopfii]